MTRAEKSVVAPSHICVLIPTALLLAAISLVHIRYSCSMTLVKKEIVGRAVAQKCVITVATCAPQANGQWATPSACGRVLILERSCCAVELHFILITA